MDVRRRRAKAAKIVAVLSHFLGRERLDGLLVLDLGSSTGFTLEALAATGASCLGVDIDTGALARARARPELRGTHMLAADGSRLPLPAASVDVVVLNHIYEHVVDADAVLDEIRRVLRPDGVVYLGLGNKHGIVEPHYRLPFLSWMGQRTADRYLCLTRRGEHYYERYRTRSGLVAMCHGLRLWEYTYAVLAAPATFHTTDMVRAGWPRVPQRAWRLLRPVMPTFIWVGTPGDRAPATGSGAAGPEPVR